MNNNEMKQQINELSSYVLDKTIKKEKACLYMSAYLCALINDNMRITARLISGSLVIKNTKIFSHELYCRYLLRGAIIPENGMVMLGLRSLDIYAIYQSFVQFFQKVHQLNCRMFSCKHLIDTMNS